MSKERLKTEKITFPKRLFDVVNSSEDISWTEDGQSFYIKDLQLFETKVMKTQFNNTTLLSFFRQVQLYGFKRIVDGRKTRHQMRTNNAYFQHPSFKRGRPDLIVDISREKRKIKPVSETDISSKPKIVIPKYIPYRAKKQRKKYPQSLPKETNNQIKTSPMTEIQTKANNSPELQVDSNSSIQPLNIIFPPYFSSQDTNVLPYENPILFHNAMPCPSELSYDSLNLQHAINFNESLQGSIPTQPTTFQTHYSCSTMNAQFPYSPF